MIKKLKQTVRRKSKAILSGVLALILLLTGFLLFVSPVVSAEAEPQFKFNAHITGNVCEIWGVNPNRQEGDWVTMLATANKKPDASNLSGADIAYIDQFETGKNGSFMMRFTLLTDRISYDKGHRKIYIAMSSQGCGISNYMEVDVHPVTGDVSKVATNSIRAGMDVYEMSSTLLTEDNLLDSIKAGGNQIYFKLGSNWYNLLDDKCVNSDWLVPANALTSAEVNELLWAKYYKGGSTTPVYFK